MCIRDSYKTPASIEETDGYPLGLTYHSDRTAERSNGQWNEEGEGVRGTSMSVSYTHLDVYKRQW